MARGRRVSALADADELATDVGIGPIDEHVGARICARRKLLQLSQKELADQLGVTFQQVQKYEKGVNRIGAGRLFSIASILGVDVGYFYKDISPDMFANLGLYDKAYAKGSKFLDEDEVHAQFDALHGAEATMLLKAFYALPPKARASLLTMLTNLRDRGEDADD